MTHFWPWLLICAAQMAIIWNSFLLVRGSCELREALIASRADVMIATRALIDADKATRSWFQHLATAEMTNGKITVNFDREWIEEIYATLNQSENVLRKLGAERAKL